MDTQKLCRLLNIDEETFKINLEKTGLLINIQNPYLLFFKNLDSRTLLTFQENLYQFPGFYPTLRAVRKYPEPYGAHYLGYISEVNKRDIDQSEGLYKLGDYIGVTGLEKQYEEYLKGEKGVHFVIKDKLGREVGSFENGRLDRDAISGYDMMLSIDVELQKYGEELMKHKVGSIVAIEPSSGEILAAVSSPNFDPNLLSFNPNRGRDYAYLLKDTLKPLFDRSASAIYPPGSIFKPILALIAMQEGVLNENTPHACTGAYYYKNVSYGCHRHPSPYNLSVALQHSCNSYFIETFRDLIEINGFDKPKIGLDLLSKYLGKFGLGKPLESDLSTENGGFIPTSDYYSRLYKTDNWRSTYIISVGIGQGELQLTTLQMANLAAILANQGHYYAPHLIKQFSKTNQTIPERFRTKIEIPIHKNTMNP